MFVRLFLSFRVVLKKYISTNSLLSSCKSLFRISQGVLDYENNYSLLVGRRFARVGSERGIFAAALWRPRPMSRRDANLLSTTFDNSSRAPQRSRGFSQNLTQQNTTRFPKIIVANLLERLMVCKLSFSTHSISKLCCLRNFECLLKCYL